MSVQWNVYESFQALIHAGPYHLALEGILLVWILWLLIIKNPKEKKTKLTLQEEEQLLTEWTPEPLISNVPYESHPDLAPRIVESKVEKYVTINGCRVLNLSSHNYLGLSGKKEIEEAALQCLDKYGVGSCGPRGFYGTTQVHLDLEEKLAQFFGCEGAILYSYGFSTMASAIPAYAKRGDVIFADECINFALQRGLQASRSRCVYFRHNDPEHLEELLKEQSRRDKKEPKKAQATRRFLVIEGTYMNSGCICPIDRMIELRRKYKLRVFLDDSLSFGTIGLNGRGIMSLYDIPLSEIDLLMVSLELAAAGTGGFCVGTKFVIEHQRLSGLGYCFSASMPPMLSAASIKVVEILEKTGNEMVEEVQDRCSLVQEKFADLNDKFELLGDERSCVKHYGMRYHLDCRDEEERILREIVEECNVKGVAFVVASHIKGPELPMPAPSIRIAVNRELSDDEISLAADVLKRSLEWIIKKNEESFVGDTLSGDSDVGSDDDEQSGSTGDGIEDGFSSENGDTTEGVVNRNVERTT